MSTLQNEQLIEQLMEEYQELGGNLKDIDIRKNPSDIEVVEKLKEEIYKLKDYPPEFEDDQDEVILDKARKIKEKKRLLKILKK